MKNDSIVNTISHKKLISFRIWYAYAINKCSMSLHVFFGYNNAKKHFLGGSSIRHFVNTSSWTFDSSLFPVNPWQNNPFGMFPPTFLWQPRWRKLNCCTGIPYQQQSTLVSTTATTIIIIIIIIDDLDFIDEPLGTFPILDAAPRMQLGTKRSTS